MNTPVLTGLHELDELTGGFKPGELILLGARPAMGKTSFAVQLLERTGIGEKQDCMIVSLESSKEQLTLTLYALQTGMGLRSCYTYKKTESDAFHEQYIKNGPIWIDDTTFELNELEEKLRGLHAVHTLRFIIIDYIQLLFYLGAADTNEKMKRLKALARELSVPIIAFSNISRAVDYRNNKRPLFSDLYPSAIFANYDQILFLYRDAYYSVDSEQNNVAEFILAKHPEGRKGTAKAMFRYTPFGCLLYTARFSCLLQRLPGEARLFTRERKANHCGQDKARRGNLHL